MKRISLFIIVLAMAVENTVQAQSVDVARMYIGQGRYIDAAKELRPLADGGDAEAQYWAAKLFLEGKFNTAKAEEQGVKYATLSADQGNERAVVLLAYYYRMNKKNQLKYFSVLSKYTSSFPEFKKDYLGYSLAECYMYGWGVTKDEDMAWFTIEGNEREKDFIKEFSDQYEAYKKRYPKKFSNPPIVKVPSNYGSRSTDSNDRIYETPEENAQFPGDVYAWLSRNIKYPSICVEQNIQGRVSVQFVINTDGSVVEEKVLRSPDDELSKEALRLIRSMPKWKPARQGNKCVRSRHILPIMFRLNSETNK